MQKIDIFISMKHFLFFCLAAALSVRSSAQTAGTNPTYPSARTNQPTRTNQTSLPPQTICNPIDLSYRYCLDTPSRREAADPSMVLYRGEYYLFASKSGGYFHSADLQHWDLIPSKVLPLEPYAPTALVIDGELYFTASGIHTIYKTNDPGHGDSWQLVTDQFPFTETDPMLFLDDDHRLYFYYGCSDRQPLHAVQLDRTTFTPIGQTADVIRANTQQYGWERAGDYNDKAAAPWMEGSWMNKINGKYYLQYACPGTQFKSYTDAVYISDHPLGPFSPAKNNPFAYKPEGFACGAGHGSTFQDKYGNYWHIGTVTISVKHMFERRLALFPVIADGDNNLSAYTGFGDYPMIIPQKKITDPRQLFPGWMLLSFHGKTTVSSALQDHPAADAVDENIRSWWSAASGRKGEFITVDLGSPSTVHAIQINFADENTTIFGRGTGMAYKYVLESSVDNNSWTVLADRSENTRDAPHDYIQLQKPIKARYIRLTNIAVPSGNFALSGLRVFGRGNRMPPKAPATYTVERNAGDRTSVKLSWKKEPGATGYCIRYGTDSNRLYETYMVYDDDGVTIRSLNAGLPYYFSIDAFNETSVTKGTAARKID